MDSLPHLQEAFEGIKDRRSIVEPTGELEPLSPARQAQASRIFQLIENQPIGTLQKIEAMQRVMKSLIAEQEEELRFKTTSDVLTPVYPWPFPARLNLPQTKQQKRHSQADQPRGASHLSFGEGGVGIPAPPNQ